MLKIFLIPVTIDVFNGPHFSKNWKMKICPITRVETKRIRFITKLLSLKKTKHSLKKFRNIKEYATFYYYLYLPNPTAVNKREYRLKMYIYSQERRDSSYSNSCFLWWTSWWISFSFKARTPSKNSETSNKENPIRKVLDQSLLDSVLVPGLGGCFRY